MQKSNRTNQELPVNFDYKNSAYLETFMTDQKKILSRRSTNLSVSQHKRLTKSIKQSRIAGLTSFIVKEND